MATATGRWNEGACVACDIRVEAGSCVWQQQEKLHEGLRSHEHAGVMHATFCMQVYNSGTLAVQFKQLS